jgi:hypothetical protein
VIVYGDPAFQAGLTELVKRVAAAAREAAGNLDAARFALIACGQLEQGVADAPGLDFVRPVIEAASDALADAFTASRAGEAEAAKESAGRAARMLAELNSPDATVTVKQPEGYAFYTLFPEQYLAAAEEWRASAIPEPGATVLVVGVRSIGTSLSAVVASGLRRAGLRPHRLTVRPGGHPFRRETDLPDLAAIASGWALVVDEGPGLSGSSMASVARALIAAGTGGEQMAFLPGHGGDPGQAATEETMAIWRSTPRHAVPLDRVEWEGRGLAGELAALSTALTGSPVVSLRDVGGGAWREDVFQDRRCWPAVAPAFERAKFLVRHDDGNAVLWKFEGLGLGPNLSGSAASIAADRLAALSERGWTGVPLGVHLGFVASRWLEGARPSAADRAAALAAGRYVIEGSGRPLATGAVTAGFERLSEMLYWNAREALGEEPADQARRLADAARPWLGEPDERAYGDGRLDPHEWVRLANGSLLKTDAAGHDHDHTVVGPQTLAWDLAGALVEWDDRAAVLEGYRESGGRLPASPRLRFHEAAYAAFRLGLVRMTLDSSGDPNEVTRLGVSLGRYRSVLEAALVDDSASLRP